MAYEYDRFEREEGGGSFLMGLLAGTVLGAGLGMLFAPKAGSELRSQLSESATKLRSTAGESVQQASEKVSQMMDRGREAYDRARSSVSNMAASGGTGPARTPTSARRVPSNGRRRGSSIRRFRRQSDHDRAAGPHGRQRRDGCGGGRSAVFVLRKPPLRRLAVAARAIPGSKARSSSGRPPSCGAPGSRAARTRVSARPWRRADVTSLQRVRYHERGDQPATRGPCALRAEIRLTAARHLARRGRRLQQQRPHVRLVDRLLLAALALPVLPAGVLDPRQRHVRTSRIAPRSSSSSCATSRASSSS